MSPTPVRTPASWRLAAPAVVLGIAAAVVGLDRRPLWLDESFSLGATNQLLETIPGTSGTMVAYYLLLDPWASVSSSVWWLRLLSVVCAAAALVPLAAIARRIGGRPLAVRATVAAALAAEMTRYAQEARSYALVVLLVTTSWWVFVRALEEDDPRVVRRLRAALAVLGVVAVLAHGLASLSVIAIGVAAALHPQRDRALRLVAPAVAGCLGTTAVLLAGGAGDVGTWWLPPLSVGRVAQAAGAYTSPLWWAALPLGALVVLGAVALLRAGGADAEARWRASIAVIWVAVPSAGLIALSAVRPSFDHRYLIGIVPGVALLLAQGTVVADRRVHRTAGTVGVASLAALALLVPGQVRVHTDGYDDWRGAADVVAAGAREGDGLAFAKAFHRTPFEAAWREVPAATPEPTLVGFDRPLGTVRRHDESRPQDAEDAAIAAHDRMWVVVAVEPGVEGDVADAVLDRPGVVDRFRIVEDRHLGGTVRVLLLAAA